MRSDLQPLIVEPREDLAVEYKNWLDLDQEEDKATLAKSCIALANHGGGFLVIGFEEQADSLLSNARPAAIAEITQDTVNSVIRRYADPDFHCQLYTIPHPTTHVSHPIVAVPGGLSEPVISRRTCSGTIQQHRCYIRKPGPRSEAPQTAEEWRTLLRRCVQANREDMLSAIRAIVLGRAETDTSTPDSIHEFEDFRTTSFERWRTVTHHADPKSPERFPNGFYEVSVHPTHLTPASSLGILQEHLSHARRTKLTGWTPFLEMNREEWRPYPIEDHIEAWIGQRLDENTPREPAYSDYWRASRKGQLYTIRGYAEDSLETRLNVQPGTVVDVTLPIWRVGEVLYFAARFLDEFEDVRAILINCRFTGLFGRTITSLTQDRFVTTSRSCRSDHVETSANVDPHQLRENMVEIVHQILTPLYEAFDFFTLSRTLVEEELSRLRENRF
ncbi:MAG: putative DNA binding domain-containing protein [Gammaproteobacteria bacterium]|nr:putative DNA binding domain-containing protein [Gammaproteobacteria bacterium]